MIKSESNYDCFTSESPCRYDSKKDLFLDVRECVNDLSKCIDNLNVHKSPQNNNLQDETCFSMRLIDGNYQSGFFTLQFYKTNDLPSSIVWRRKSDVFPYYNEVSMTFDSISSYSIAPVSRDTLELSSMSSHTLIQLSINCPQFNSPSLFILPLIDVSSTILANLPRLLKLPLRPPILEIPSTFSDSVKSFGLIDEPLIHRERRDLVILSPPRSPLGTSLLCSTHHPETRVSSPCDNSHKVTTFEDHSVSTNSKFISEPVVGAVTCRSSLPFGTMLVPSKTNLAVPANNTNVTSTIDNSDLIEDSHGKICIRVENGSRMDLTLDGFPFWIVSPSPTTEVAVSLQGALLADLSCLLNIPPRCLRILKLDAPQITLKIVDYSTDISNALTAASLCVSRDDLDNFWASGTAILKRITRRVPSTGSETNSCVKLRRLKVYSLLK